MKQTVTWLPEDKLKAAAHVIEKIIKGNKKLNELLSDVEGCTGDARMCCYEESHQGDVYSFEAEMSSANAKEIGAVLKVMQASE